MIKIAVLWLAVILAGCASPTRWVKPDATQADFDADKSFCQYESIKYAGGYDNSYQSAFGSSLDMAMRRNEIAAACMHQKGWSAQK